MNNPLTTREAAELLRGADNILILTHHRPDGDTIGCAAGLCAALRQIGKTAYMLPNPDITPTNEVYAAPYWATEGFAPDFVVSVDIAARKLLYPAADAYFDRIDLAIDHHPTFEGFGRAQCVNPTCAACGEILYEICARLGEMSHEVALPLYAAVCTDTGCFLYANTTANTHAVAAKLMETGIDYFSVNKRHYRTKSRQRIALESRAMSEIRYFHEGKGTFVIVPLSMMEDVGATAQDAEDLASLVTVVEGVDCGVLMRELTPGEWKISLRTGVNRRVSASEACALLGGGGHAMASGATLMGSEDEVRERILAAIEAVKKY